MRLVLILIAAVSMAACATFIPTTERTIELPTLKYSQPTLTAKEVILKVKESCDLHGRFMVDGEPYICRRHNG